MKKQITQLTKIRNGLLVLMLCFSLFTYAENKGGQTMLPGVPESTVVYQGELVPYVVGSDVIYTGTIKLSEIPNFTKYFRDYLDGVYEFFVHKSPSGGSNNVATFVRDIRSFLISDAKYIPDLSSQVWNSAGNYEVAAYGVLSFESTSPRGTGSMTIDLYARCNESGTGSFYVSIRHIVLPPPE